MKVRKNIDSWLVLIGLGLLVFYSCKSEEEKPVSEKPLGELLCDKSWKVQHVWIAPSVPINGDMVNDFFTLYNPCLADNLYVFNKNGVGYIDENKLKCEPDAPQRDSFTWSFKNENTHIEQSYGMDGKIGTLTEQEFSLIKEANGSEVQGGDPDINYRITIVFTNQE